MRTRGVGLARDVGRGSSRVTGLRSSLGAIVSGIVTSAGVAVIGTLGNGTSSVSDRVGDVRTRGGTVSRRVTSGGEEVTSRVGDRSEGRLSDLSLRNGKRVFERLLDGMICCSISLGDKFVIVACGGSLRAVVTCRGEGGPFL